MGIGHTNQQITTYRILDTTILGDDIAPDAIDSEHIANYAIILRHLASDLVFALALGEEELKELRANEEHGYANVEER